MALNIKDPETDRLARRLSRLTGESITLAVRTAVRERIEQGADARQGLGRGVARDCQANRRSAESGRAQ